jgi:hypothetical protein
LKKYFRQGKSNLRLPLQIIYYKCFMMRISKINSNQSGISAKQGRTLNVKKSDDSSSSGQRLNGLLRVKAEKKIGEESIGVIQADRLFSSICQSGGGAKKPESQVGQGLQDVAKQSPGNLRRISVGLQCLSRRRLAPR